MRIATSLASVIAVVLLLLTGSLFGCGGSAVGQRSVYGSIGWGSSGEPNPVPGVHHAMVDWFVYGETLTFIIWVDLVGGGDSGSLSSSVSTSSARSTNGHFESTDGRRLEYEYHISLDESDSVDMGSITIDGRRYDLKDGSLLLVTTLTDEVEVRQMALDPTVFGFLKTAVKGEDARAGFRSLANENTQIRSFFERPLSTPRSVTAQ